MRGSQFHTPVVFCHQEPVVSQMAASIPVQLLTCACQCSIPTNELQYYTMKRSILVVLSIEDLSLSVSQPPASSVRGPHEGVQGGQWVT